MGASDPANDPGNDYSESAPHPGEGDNEDGGLERDLRAFLEGADPPPDEYRSFSRLAYEFRELAVAEIVTDGELAGVRAGSNPTDGNVCGARFGADRLVWRLERSGLAGAIVPARSVMVRVEGLKGPIDERRTDETGSFAFDRAIAPPYRLVVDVGDAVWATPWRS